MTPTPDVHPAAGAFRAALRRLASTVAVVTAGEGDAAMGMTATAVTSLSLEPASMIVCINRGTRLHRAVTESGAFRVTWLEADQSSIAVAFSTAGMSVEDRFQVGGWTPATCGWRLPGAMAEAECRLEQVLDFGTHTVFVGEVLEAGAGCGEPLLYCGGAYATPQAMQPAA